MTPLVSKEESMVTKDPEYRKWLVRGQSSILGVQLVQKFAQLVDSDEADGDFDNEALK